MRKSSDFQATEERVRQVARDVLNKAEDDGTLIPDFACLFPVCDSESVVLAHIDPRFFSNWAKVGRLAATGLKDQISDNKARSFAVCYKTPICEPLFRGVPPHEINHNEWHAHVPGYRILVIDADSSVDIYWRLAYKDSYEVVEELETIPARNDPFMVFCYPKVVANLAATN